MSIPAIPAPAASAPHLADSRRAPAGTSSVFAALLDQAAQAQARPVDNGEMPDQGPDKAGVLWHTLFPPLDAPAYFTDAWAQVNDLGLPSGAMMGLQLDMMERMYGSLSDPGVPAFGPDMTYTELVSHMRESILKLLAEAPEQPAGTLTARLRALDLLLDSMNANRAQEARDRPTI